MNPAMKPATFSALHFVSGVRALEAEIFRRAPSREIMRRAGREASLMAAQTLQNRKDLPILALAGPGNNGGDALIAAADLRAKGWNIAAVFHGNPQTLSEDARWAHSEWKNNGGNLTPDIPANLPPENFALALDGIFGIGLTREVSGAYAEWITRLNASPCKTLSLDIPSGLNADTGKALGPTVRAHATATFLTNKPGLFTGDGPERCGKIRCFPLTSPPKDETVSASDSDSGAGVIATSDFGEIKASSDWDSNLERPAGFLLDGLRDAARLFPPLTAHKGSRGTLALIGGARGMEGALILATRAAALLGAGKVFAIPLSPAAPSYDSHAPEVMWRNDIPATATAIAIGPGLGKSPEAKKILHASIESPVPLLADADALNIIAEDSSLQKSLRTRAASTILTPHPSEASRLLSCETTEIESDRIKSAEALSKTFHADIVLKGAGSVLHFTGGGWCINTSGNPGLARAGSGDVLSGIISSFLSQTADASLSLESGVWLHGAAADALAKKHNGIFGWKITALPSQAGRILNRIGF